MDASLTEYETNSQQASVFRDADGSVFKCSETGGGMGGSRPEVSGMRCGAGGDLTHNEEQEDEDVWRGAAGVRRRCGICLGASGA